MTEQERFQRAFAPLHAPSDTLTEVMKMTEQTHRKSGRRTAVIALAAALLLATGSAAYAADLGSIQRRVQLWLHGDQTDAVMTVEPGHYTLEYTDENGETQQRGGGGVAFEPDGTERPLTPEELASLRERCGAAVFFSEELCANYFSYTAQGRAHFVLFDTAETLRCKLRLGRERGMETAFLMYPEVSDLLPELLNA